MKSNKPRPYIEFVSAHSRKTEMAFIDQISRLSRASDSKNTFVHIGHIAVESLDSFDKIKKSIDKAQRSEPETI